MTNSKPSIIGRHTFFAFGGECIISTVLLPYSDTYETMVLDPGSDELSCKRTKSLEEAKRNHNDAMNYWNDRLYDSSLQKAIGMPNLGQFVTTIKAC